jgi:hypothetical protein
MFKFNKHSDLYVDKYASMYELSNWIDLSKLTNKYRLWENPIIVDILRKIPEKNWPDVPHISSCSHHNSYWDSLSVNPALITVLIPNKGEIFGDSLSRNPSNARVLLSTQIDWWSILDNYMSVSVMESMDEFKKDFYFDSCNPASIDFLEKNPEKIDWESLSTNPAAIHLLEKNPEKIDWGWLSANPAAIHLLKKNPEKISWSRLSFNPAAINLLEKNPEEIYWPGLSKNPAAIHILKKNPENINWNALAQNTSIVNQL